MNEKARQLLSDLLWLILMTLCMVAIFVIGVGMGYENGINTQMSEDQKLLTNCQQVIKGCK